MTICYFTASGNSLYVARRIGGNLLSIPKLMRQEKIEIEDDAVGIICPVYAAELPIMVMDFMRTAEIRTEYFFFVLTCGDRFDIVLGHAEQAAQARGWDLKYADGVKMVYNYLPMYDMQEEVAKLPQKDVEGQINRVCANICDRKEQRVVVNEELRTQMELYHNNYALKANKLSIIFDDKAAAREALDRVRTFIKNNPTVYLSTHCPEGYENLEMKRVMKL